MYDLIIIDDEEIIRKGMEELFNWNQMGFRLCASFDDGRDAIKFLEKTHVDVVLTDIKMLDVSGLEVAKYVHEYLPHAKTVIVSGYKEFEYAKKAIEYGVEHFLLKPTKFNELQHVFSELKEKLDRIREKEQQVKKEREKYLELIPLLQEQFFEDLTRGAIKDVGSIQKRIDLFGLSVDVRNFPCCLSEIEISDYEQQDGEQEERGKATLKNLLMNLFNDPKRRIRCFFIYRTRHIWDVLALSTLPMSAEELKTIFVEQTDNACSSISKILGIRISIRSCQYYENLMELSAGGTLSSLHKDKDTEYQIFDIDLPKYNGLMEKYRHFAVNINTGSAEEIISLSDSLIADITPFPIRFQKHFIINFLAVLTNRLGAFGVELGREVVQTLNYDMILYINDFEGIKQYCRNALMTLARLDQQNRDESKEKLVEDAKKFIMENYSRDITLDDIAGKVHLSSAYFSRIFKQVTGENFMDHLTEVRIKKAMQLIGDNRYKIQKISEMVGYSNSNYFSKVFKQHTGYAPREFFRKRHYLNPEQTSVSKES